MTKKLKPFFIAIVVIIVLFMAGRYILDLLFGDMCGNERVQEVSSPNGEKVAHIFNRDCGATTGVSWQLSIIDKGDELPNKSGNTFVSDQEFKINWISDKKLLVNYKKSSKTYEMDKSVNWTKIEYVVN
ncbi:hypothetical protein AWH48_12425 [Domibacillus aminovorans]|uniref:Uncharacterized protein n=1 Tax=Domibacillus aminovorans TaxID=29332 RepID=A0A177KJT6_9BACI|nr:DUF5412 family protein [Domibacillus aminovorans]OAH53155.1 hypothetical protein AWH48_12425 [Domibacillus aminovorans]